MSIKNSIGLRIKTERESQQMSREVLCLDGKELTVRQLIRIEKGESLPSLDKLSYIAKRLGKAWLTYWIMTGLKFLTLTMS